MSNDRPVHELLPWYLTGTLEPSLAERFRDHLEGCEACRTEMAFLERLRGQLEIHGAAFLEDHPPVELLVAALRGEAPQDEETRVRRHLALCVSCAEEAGLVSGELVYGGSGEAGAAPHPAPRWVGWALGIAAALLLVVLPLALLSRGDDVVSGIMRMNHILAPERAAAEPNVVELAPGETKSNLVFEIDLPVAAFPVTVVIRDGAGGTVVTVPDVEIDELLDGYFYLECSRSDCPSGSYGIQVLAGAATEPRLTLHFRIVER